MDSGTTEKIAQFARERIAERPDLYDSDADFPFDLWGEMGRTGLLGLGLPEEYGGGGANYRTLLAAGEALVRNGRNLGISAAWLSHTLISRLIIGGQGNAEQRQRFLPMLASGELTPAVAISEPNAGAHPKRLASRADRDGDTWILNGEKAWLTNGPIAGLYIILAISGVTNGRKQFSAFLVPRDTPGLAQTNAGSVDFLRPARHGGLKITDCRIPAENLLGTEGGAFETISLPLREVEDALGLGTGLGGRAAQLDLLVQAVREQKLAPDDDQFQALGELSALQDATRSLAFRIAESLDIPDGQAPAALLLATRRLSRQFQSDLHSVIKSLNLVASDDFSRLNHDMNRSGGLATNVDRAKQGKLGKSMIMKAG